MKFIIDRTKWLRGEGYKQSRLLRPSDGKQCCLGQIGRQCGLSVRSIKDQIGPSDAVQKFHSTRMKWPEPLRPTPAIGGISCDPDLSRTMMLVNDDTDISDSEREARLIDLAKVEHIELEFIN